MDFKIVGVTVVMTPGEHASIATSARTPVVFLTSCFIFVFKVRCKKVD